MKLFCLVIPLLVPGLLLSAEEIQNTSYIMSSGERVLRFEFTIPVSKQDVWQLLATAEGWKKWAAPVVSVDLKVGGSILTNYDKTKQPGDSGTIRLPIINYLEGEILTLKVVLNESFVESVRRDDQNLQEIIQIFDLGGNKTKVVSSMIGWGEGADWDKAYEFFANGNKWSYEQLLNLFRPDKKNGSRSH